MNNRKLKIRVAEKLLPRGSSAANTALRRSEDCFFETYKASSVFATIAFKGGVEVVVRPIEVCFGTIEAPILARVIEIYRTCDGTGKEFLFDAEVSSSIRSAIDCASSRGKYIETAGLEE